MAKTMLVYGSISGKIDGISVAAGSIDTPSSFSIKGRTHEVIEVIGNGNSVTLYANSLGKANTIAIECNQTTRVAFKDTSGASWSLNFRGTGKKGVPGAPTIFTMGNTLNTATYINSMVAHNLSGSSCKIHCLVAK